MSSGSREARPPARGTRWTRRRRTVQTLIALFFLVLPLTQRSGQVQVMGTLASLRLGPIDLVDPACGISAILADPSHALTILAGLALPVLLALALGPVFCAWACPWGLLSEGIDAIKRRPARGRGRHRSLTPAAASSSLRGTRYGVLAGVFLLSVGLGTPVAAILSAPRAITQLPIELLFLGSVGDGTLLLLGGFLLLEIVLPRRLWCRVLCPVGSTLSLLRTPWTLTIAWRAPTCDSGACAVRCVKECSWRLEPRAVHALDGCTNCGACVEGCPSRPLPSLSFRARR